MKPPNHNLVSTFAGAIALLAALGLPHRPAFAARSVVVMPFAGPRGKETADQLARMLGYKQVSATAFNRAKKHGGAKRAAAKLGVVGQVRGAITRLHGVWAVRVVVRDAQGTLLGRQILPLRGARVDPATMKRLVRSVRAMLRKTGTRGATRRRGPGGGGKPAATRGAAGAVGTADTAVSKPPQTPKTAATAGKTGDASSTALVAGGDVVVVGGDEDPASSKGAGKGASTDKSGGGGLGFAVGAGRAATGGSGRTASPPPLRARPRPRVTYQAKPAGPRRPVGARRGATRTRPVAESEQPSGRKEWDTIVEAALGLVLLNRSFVFTKAPDNPPAYATPAVIPAIGLDLDVYPFAALDIPVLSDLGLGGMFSRALGLKSNPPNTDQLADTVLQNYEFGLRWRWNILDELTSPTLRVGLDFGQQYFVINTPTGVAEELPDIVYTYVKPSIAADWVYYAESGMRLGLFGAFDLPLVLSAGDIENEVAQGGFGSASVFAFDIGLGFYARYAGFTARLTGNYRRFSLDFGCQGAGCRAAADTYVVGALLLGYVF